MYLYIVVLYYITILVLQGEIDIKRCIIHQITILSKKTMVKHHTNAWVRNLVQRIPLPAIEEKAKESYQL
jgi:hypothetical protein